MTHTAFPSSPHMLTNNSVPRVMLGVLYALLPGIAAYILFFGWGIIINIAIALATALLAEALILRLRQRPILPYLTDGSAALTAVLLALALPPLAPWWLAFIGTSFAIIIAKHLYGGLGYNPFNPAMVGYAVLLIAFPQEMTAWLPPDLPGGYHANLPDLLQYSFLGSLPTGVNYDAITAATPLDTIKTGLGLNKTLSEITATPLFGSLAGRGWEWVNGMFLLGGLWLIARRIISWHIPIAFLSTLALLALLAHIGDPDSSPSMLFHLFSGATMLGAFFIATDPVTAATTPRGKLVYGIGIGLLVYIIRTWGGYPDGIAFAVLLLNMAVPTIDYYTQPRVFGHEKD